MTATRVSESARRSRRELPEGAQAALWDAIDVVTDDPKIGEPLTDDGAVRLYRHPEPPLQITYEYDPTHDRITFRHFSVTHVDLVRHVFLSYSHDDGQWRKRICDELRPFEKIGAIRLFVDSEIPAGVPWESFLEENLDSATGALMLVSKSFLEPGYALDREIPAILDQAPRDGFHLLWVLVRECDWETDENGRRIGAYQALLNPNKALADLGPAIARKLRLLQNRFAEAMSLRRQAH